MRFLSAPHETWERSSSTLVASAQYYSNLLVVPRGPQQTKRAKDKGFTKKTLLSVSNMFDLTYRRGKPDHKYFLKDADEVDTAKIIEIYPHSQRFSVPYFIISIRFAQSNIKSYSSTIKYLFLSILELCVFLYHVVNLRNHSCIEIDAYGPVPTCSVLIYNPYRRYEVWRLLTYLAVHGGYIHIASNIIGAIF